MKCPYCDRPREGNASDYYHEKQCEADHLLKEIERRSGEPDIVKKLKAKLEMARYVGD